MRKLFAILVLCCLIVITGGYQFLYHMRISEAKREMKTELLKTNSADLTKFIFTSAELNTLYWEDDSEFRYNGEMHDVVRKLDLPGKTVVWCLPDKKETALLNQYMKSQKQSSQKNSSLIKLLSVQFICCQQSLIKPLEKRVETIFNNYLFLLSHRENVILTPPPRFA